jgi:type VI secretion system secreted protein VgrG
MSDLLAAAGTLAADTFARILSQDRSAIWLRFPDQAGKVFDGVLLPQRLDIVEGVCEGVKAHVTCLTTRADLPLNALVGLPIEVQMVTDTGDLKRWCVVVTQVRQGESDGALTLVQLTAQDVFALMEQRRGTRVFLDQSLPEVVRTVLDGWRRRFPALGKCFDYQFLALQEDRYPQRAFLMQAGQSDAGFLRSLVARDGVNWVFRPGPDGPGGTPMHMLVLFDDARQLPANAAGAVRFHRLDGTEPRDAITLLAPMHTLVAGEVRLASWDHEAARVDMASEVCAVDQGCAGSELAQALREHRIVLPHAGDSAEDFRRLARIHQERHEARAAVLLGAGGVRAQCVGEYNRIDGHAGLGADPAEREYITLRLEHWAENNLPKDLNERAQAMLAASSARIDGWFTAAAPAEDLRSGSRRYTNRFVAVRRDAAIRPPWNPQDDLPPMQLMSATVVSAAEQPVWTDGLMRVKVCFHGLDPADHEHAGGAGTQGSAGDSAWVRVHMPWAGDGHGFLFTPRPGMEVSIAFEQGDPSRPVIVGCRYNGANAPARFDRLGSLPANHALSGIVTRELNSLRQQQLRFNDTPGNISVQLASDHAASQLNLGSLATPMSEGRTEPRGEGAELRSDGATAVRGARGVLVSSHARPQAGGHHLDREELLGLAQALEGVAQQMADLAASHQAGQNDSERLRQLVQHLREWEHGSNAGPDAAGGGAPVVAVTSAAGTAVASQDNLLLGAQTHLDAVAINHLQATAGQDLLLRSGELLAAFAQAAMKLIAKLDVSIESHTANVRIAAAKVIDLVAGEKVRIQAPEVEIVAQGAATRWGGGSVVEQAQGPFVVKAASFAQSSGGDGVPQGVSFAGQDVQFDQQVVVCAQGSEEPLKQCRYLIKTASGATYSGITDDQGLTQRFALREPYGAYTIEFPSE